MTPNEALRQLDAYLAALRAMPNPVGDAVRAMEHAEAAHLPPLETYIAGQAARDASEGTSEQDFLLHRLSLGWERPIPNAPHADAPHRLGQVIATLMDAGLWPWS